MLIIMGRAAQMKLSKIRDLVFATRASVLPTRQILPMNQSILPGGR
jgi:hypothetical protein